MFAHKVRSGIELYYDGRCYGSSRGLGAALLEGKQLAWSFTTEIQPYDPLQSHTGARIG